MLAFSRVLLLVWLALVASIPFALPKMQVSRDFAAFWTAARLAADGQAAAAYGEASLAGLAALFGPGTYPPFFYPPTALLLWLPFSALGFVAAASVWVALTLALYAMSLRAMEASLVTAMAFPSVLFCALYGQNALFSAALFGGIALTLDRAPLAAGVLIGCLAYKPQLGVLIPLAMLCARRWRVFAAASCTVVALSLLSAAVFGPHIWTAFLASLPVAQAWNAHGVPGFDRFVSPYAAARLLGAPAAAGWIAQAAFALAACLALIRTSLRRPGAAAETAMLVVATGFCVPFLGEYDLCMLAVPGAWIAAQAVQSGWLPYERILLAALYLSPIPIKGAALHGIPLGPAAMTVLAVLVARRQASGTSFQSRH